MFKNLEEKFRIHCNTKNLELNPNQINTIQKLKLYYEKNFEFSPLNFL